jgi:hypothetical protein
MNDALTKYKLCQFEQSKTEAEPCYDEGGRISICNYSATRLIDSRTLLSYISIIPC